MQINPDLTLREVATRLERSGRRLHLHFEHGVYHAYVIDPSKSAPREVTAYDRGDLAEAVGGATADLA